MLDVQVAPPVVCNQETTVRARIRNDGSDEAQNVAWVIAEAALLSDGAALSENPPLAYLKTLKAAEEDTVEIPITLTERAGEEQFIRVVVDSGNHLPETDERTTPATARPSFWSGAAAAKRLTSLRAPRHSPA